MNKALIVSLYFPPMAGLGPLRLGKFARYLPEFGWEPFVLTTTVREDYPQTTALQISEANIIRVPYRVLSFALKQKILAGGNAPARTATGAPSLRKWAYQAVKLLSPIYHRPEIASLLVRDRKWDQAAYARGIEVIRLEKPTVIHASTSFSLAAKLSQDTGIPWVAEFRELWSQNPRNRKIFPLQLLEARKEKETIKTAGAIVTISDTLARYLEEFHRRQITVISNGFDEEDYAEKVPLTSKFTLTFIGGLADRRRLHPPLFEAIGELRREGLISEQNFELRFIGTDLQDDIRGLADKFQIADVTTLDSWVPLQESIRRQKESSALFFMLGWMDPTEYGVCPGKVFEYLGAGRPILGCATEQGDISKVVSGSGCGVIASRKDDIKAILARWVSEFRTTGNVTYRYAPKPEIVKEYTRRELTRKLADVYREVADGKQGAHRPG